MVLRGLACKIGESLDTIVNEMNRFPGPSVNANRLFDLSIPYGTIAWRIIDGERENLLGFLNYMIVKYNIGL